LPGGAAAIKRGKSDDRNQLTDVGHVAEHAVALEEFLAACRLTWSASDHQKTMDPLDRPAGSLQTGTPQRGGAQAVASARGPGLEQARLKLEEANKAMQKGDWEQFGKAMQELEQQLIGKPE